MYTVEFEHDNVNITILDDAGAYEDLSIDAFDDVVYIHQSDEHITSIVAISPQMWEQLIAAIHSAEGAHIKRTPHD